MAEALMRGTDDAYRECFLYVEASSHDVVTEELRHHLGVDDDLGTFTLTDAEVVVVHGAEWPADPTDDFVRWRAKVEIYAAPSTAAQTVVELVRDLMIYLRHQGHRVVASCDFEDDLPQRDWLEIKARERR